MLKGLITGITVMAAMIEWRTGFFTDTVKHFYWKAEDKIKESNKQSKLKKIWTNLFA